MITTQYCIFGFNGYPLTYYMEYLRKDCEASFLKNVGTSPKFESWAFWYRRGYRIKKVKVELTII